MHLAIHFCISRSSVVPSRNVDVLFFLFFLIFCQCLPFRWSNFDLELIYFALSMNTSSPQHRLESGICFKTKMTKTSIQRRTWRNFIQHCLVVPIFIHSISLLFEVNASLKCASSGSSHITTVHGCYRKLSAHFYGAA